MLECQYVYIALSMTMSYEPACGSRGEFDDVGHGTIQHDQAIKPNEQIITHVVGGSTGVHHLHVTILMLAFDLLRGGEDMRMVIA